MRKSPPNPRSDPTVSLRKSIALIALVNALVALYLHLWKIGLTGSLACTGGGGGCEFVQGSRYGWFFGVDVALIGAVGYTLLFAAAAVGGVLEEARWPTRVMQGMIWGAVLFTIRLKYGEFIVLKSFCPWCAISAVSITVCAVLVTLDARRLRVADRN
ncbi:MAG: hypothetical protein RLZZ621_1169 [Gemmatimonadota bacterium]